VVARLGQGVTVLAWLLLVKETTGGFSEAGLVGACISLATAATAPVAGRLADRFGAGRVLPLYATAYALLQLLLMVAVLARMPLVLLCVVAALSGAAFPAISPALRASRSMKTENVPSADRAGTRPLEIPGLIDDQHRLVMQGPVSTRPPPWRRRARGCPC
jgi:MFS family permease